MRLFTTLTIIVWLLSFSVNLHAQEKTSFKIFNASDVFSSEKVVDIESKFNESLNLLATHFGVLPPHNSIALRRMYSCMNDPKFGPPPDDICYSDWYYPSDKLYLLPRYKNSLVHYALAKHLINRNLYLRWYHIEVGSIKKHYLELESDVIEGAALLIQYMLGGNFVVDEIIMNDYAARHVNKGHYNGYRSYVYFLFLKQMFMEKPDAVLNFLKVLLGTQSKEESYYKFLEDTKPLWNKFKSNCAKVFFHGDDLPKDTVIFKDYWPSSIHSVNGVIDLQTVNGSNKPSAVNFEIILSQKGFRKRLRSSPNVNEILYAGKKNGVFLIRRSKGVSKAFLRSPKGTSIDLNAGTDSVLDVGFDIISDSVGLLSPNYIYIFGIKRNTKWTKYSSKLFDIGKVSSISGFSLNFLGLITIDDDSKGERTAVLWDAERDNIAPILKGYDNTYNPQWANDNKAIFFLQKIGGLYRAYRLNISSEKFDILYEGDIPRIAISDYDSEHAIVAAYTPKGTALIKLDYSNVEKTIYLEPSKKSTAKSKSLNIVEEKSLGAINTPEKYVYNRWNVVLYPFVRSDFNSYDAGLKFRVASPDNKTQFELETNYNFEAKQPEVYVKAELPPLYFDGGRRVEILPYTLGMRDSAALTVYHYFRLLESFKFLFGFDFKNIGVDTYTANRYNLLGPHAGFVFYPAENFFVRADYLLMLLTTSNNERKHSLEWHIKYLYGFKPLDLGLNMQGKHIFEDGTGTMWAIAGGQFVPLYQERPYTVRGFAKCAFFEPQFVTLNFETPLHLFRNFPFPHRDAIKWGVDLAPLADVYISSQKYNDKHWGWSGGGELRLTIRYYLLDLDFFSGVYYVRRPSDNVQYNIGGGIVW